MAGEKTQTVYCWRQRHEKLRIYFASSVEGAMMVEVRLTGAEEDCVAYFRDLLPGRKLLQDRSMNGPIIDAVQAALDNGPVPERIPLDIDGTPFQREAWRAIAEIPYGTTRTYAEVARMVGRPLAARAVGQAMGRNPLLLYFP